MPMKKVLIVETEGYIENWDRWVHLLVKVAPYWGAKTS
jgi:hypothetical protein